MPTAELSAELAGVVKAEMDRINIGAVEKAKKDGEKEKPTARKVTKNLIADVRFNLAAPNTLPAARSEPPCWLDGEGPFPAAETLAVAQRAGPPGRIRRRRSGHGSADPAVLFRARRR